MAVYSDMERIKQAMRETIANPMQLRWVHQIAISYSKSMGMWMATFDSDLTIMFDDVEYSSNSIHFIMHDKRVAHITHKGLNEFERD